MVIKLLQSTLDWQDNNYESSTTTTLKIPFQHFTNFFFQNFSHVSMVVCVCVFLILNPTMFFCGKSINCEDQNRDPTDKRISRLIGVRTMHLEMHEF